MKKIVLLSVFFALSALCAYGQDANGGQKLVGPPSTQKPKEEKTVLIMPSTPKSKILGKPVTFGGFFTDFIRSEGKRAFFDLRTPMNPQQDLENLVLFPGADTGPAVVLFRIKF